MRTAVVRGQRFWVDEESRVFYLDKRGRLKQRRFHVGQRGYKLTSTTRGAIYEHTIIASAWYPNPEGKPTVNHKNGIKTDNRIENLESATFLEQARHARFVLGVGHKPGGGLKPGKMAGIRFGPDGQVRAHINYDYRQIHVGTFATVEAAQRAREEAKRKVKELPEHLRRFWLPEKPERKRTLKYSQAQIAKARKMIAAGISFKLISEETGIQYQTVSSISTGRGQYGQAA